MIEPRDWENVLILFKKKEPRYLEVRKESCTPRLLCYLGIGMSRQYAYKCFELAVVLGRSLLLLANQPNFGR